MNEHARRVQATYLSSCSCIRWRPRSSGESTRCFCSMPGSATRRPSPPTPFFTAGMAIFEVPTGVVADTQAAAGVRARHRTWRSRRCSISCCGCGRRHSGPGQWRLRCWGWLHLLSGAVDAWLVDALTSRVHGGRRPARGCFRTRRIVKGVAMLGGSVAGGLIAQATNLGCTLPAARGVSRALLRHGVRADARHRLHTPPR